MTKRKMLKGGSLSPDVIQGLLKKSYEKKQSSFNDYQIDKSLSGERVQVYYNPSLNQAVVVHRGSAGAKDWLVNDAGLLVGYRGNRFSHAQDIQNKAEKKYGAKNVTTLGHSLGAKVAEEVGQNSKEIITLNKPTVDAKPVSGKQYDIRASSDVVSGLSGIASSSNKTTIPSGFRNPYSEHSPDVLSRLGDKPIGRGRMRGGSSSGDITSPDDFGRRYNQAQRIWEGINNRVLRILDSGDLDDDRGRIRDGALNRLGELVNQALINARTFPEFPQFNILANDINNTIEGEIRSIRDEAIEGLTERANAFPRRNRQFPQPRPPRGGSSQQVGEPNQDTIDALTQQELYVRALYTQALGAGAVNNILLGYLENLQQYIIELEHHYNNANWVSDIFDGLTNEIYESRLALQEEIQAEQEEFDGVTDEELSSLEGGKRRDGLPAELTLQHSKNRYARIQEIANIFERHHQLNLLIEKLTKITNNLSDRDPIVDDYNEFLDDISDEFVELGDEVQEALDAQAPQGGRAINPRSIVPDLMSDEDRERIARQRIEERRQAEMEQMFRRIRLAPIQNPDDMPRRAIRPRNIGAPTGGGSCFSRGQIYPDEDGDTVLSQDSREGRDFDEFYSNLNFDIESDAEGGGQGDSRVVPVTYIENELNAPVDVLDNPLPNIEPTQKPIDTYRQIQALKIMEEKKLADLEEKYFDWKAAAEEEGYYDEPYNNSKADDDHMIEQMNQAQGMLEYYTQTEEQLRRDMGIEQASGAGRFDGYSRCHDCGCDSYRDFNALHAM